MEADRDGGPRAAGWAPNRLVVKLAIKALDRREGYGAEAEIKVAKASLFPSQSIARGLIAKGRRAEIRELSTARVACLTSYPAVSFGEDPDRMRDTVTPIRLSRVTSPARFFSSRSSEFGGRIGRTM